MNSIAGIDTSVKGPGRPSPLDQVIKQISADGWAGEGPGEYTLPGVRSLYVTPNSHPTSLFANAKKVAYVSGEALEQANAASKMLQDLGAQPTSVRVTGTYGNTVFYVDGLEVLINEPALG